MIAAVRVFEIRHHLKMAIFKRELARDAGENTLISKTADWNQQKGRLE